MFLFKILLLSLISNTSKQKATMSFQQRAGLHLQESSGEKQSIVERLSQGGNYGTRGICWQEIPSFLMLTSLALPDPLLLRWCPLWGVRRSCTLFSYWDNWNVTCISALPFWKLQGPLLASPPVQWVTLRVQRSSSPQWWTGSIEHDCLTGEELTDLELCS